MGQDVEIILLKQLASCLRIPIALLSPDASVAYFNEPAEEIFGLRFEETGTLAADEWPALLQPSDEHHVPLKHEERPLMTALEQRVPAHRQLRIRSGEGRWRTIEATAVPLMAIGGRFLGAMTLFWTPGTLLGAADGHGDHAADPPPRSEGEPEQQEVETILTRRLAETWSAPVFLVDRRGRLLYFNPAAEPILGQSFENVEKLASRRALYEAFRPRDDSGSPIGPRDHPLVVARERRQPIHRTTRIRGLDGRDRSIAITAIPLVGQSDRLLGAFGVFWESAPR